jgi:hypothetical protein
MSKSMDALAPAFPQYNFRLTGVPAYMKVCTSWGGVPLGGSGAGSVFACITPALP